MYQIIKKPIVTEKNSMLSNQNAFVFEVDRKSTKTDIKKAIEKAFEVKVSEVRTCICRRKAKRTRSGMGKVSYWKKAIVKLAAGEKLNLFEGV